MTDISEVLASIKKSNLTLEELKKDFDDNLKVANQGLVNLIEPIEDAINFEKKRNDEISNYESSNQALSQEITSLKSEKQSNETLLAENQTNLDRITDERAKLETSIREVNSHLNDKNNILSTAKSELSKLTTEVETVTAEVSQIVNSSEAQILDLKKKIEGKRDAISKIKGERMALEYLIKKNHIEFNEIKIIKTLEGRKNTDLNTISKVTGLSDALIVKTLNGLMERQLLTYDSSSGAIVITGSLKI